MELRSNCPFLSSSTRRESPALEHSPLDCCILRPASTGIQIVRLYNAQLRPRSHIANQLLNMSGRGKGGKGLGELLKCHSGSVARSNLLLQALTLSLQRFSTALCCNFCYVLLQNKGAIYTQTECAVFKSTLLTLRKGRRQEAQESPQGQHSGHHQARNSQIGSSWRRQAYLRPHL